MTENGRTGPSPQMLAAMRGEDPYGHIPQPTQAYYRQAPQASRGFSAAALWDGYFDFNPDLDVQGEVPHPTQSRIDTFRREVGEWFVELQKIAHEEAEARAKVNTEHRKAAEEATAKGEEYVEPFSVAEAKKEMKRAEKDTTRLYDSLRDHAAEFCAGIPTREQLGELPDFKVLAFVNYLAGQLNPEA